MPCSARRWRRRRCLISLPCKLCSLLMRRSLACVVGLALGHALFVEQGPTVVAPWLACYACLLDCLRCCLLARSLAYLHWHGLPNRKGGSGVWGTMLRQFQAFNSMGEGEGRGDSPPLFPAAHGFGPCTLNLALGLLTFSRFKLFKPFWFRTMAQWMQFCMLGLAVGR